MNPERIHPGRSASVAPASAADECAQRLSALLDGELDAGECRALVERLHHDEQACRTWALLNCASDALRSADVASFQSEGFVGRVSAALENEPTVLAPTALPKRSIVRRWLLPGAGAAVAAALLVVAGLPSRQPASPEAVIAKAPPVAGTAGVAGATQVVDRSPQLERYLAAHRELADATVMPHSTAYVRTSGAAPMQDGR